MNEIDDKAVSDSVDEDQLVGIEARFDHNRDGFVDQLDVDITVGNHTVPSDALLLFRPPGIDPNLVPTCTEEACNDGNPCTLDSCDKTTGECIHTEKAVVMGTCAQWILVGWIQEIAFTSWWIARMEMPVRRIPAKRERVCTMTWIVGTVMPARPIPVNRKLVA